MTVALSPRFVAALPAGIAATGLILSCVSGSARADVKVVSQVTRGGTPGGTSTSTTYYKGKKFRSESPEGVVIVDSDAGKVYTLNVARKTYTLMQLSGKGSIAPMMNMFDFKSAAVVKPGGKTKTILGRPTKNYLYTITIAMSLKKEMADKMMGQAQAGGAKPAGGAPPKMPQMPTIVLEGENWVAESVSLPMGAAGASMAAIAQQVPGMQPVLQKFNTIKGLPLETHISSTVKGGPANMPQTRRSQNVTTVATSLSEAPLPDTLFQVPAGYKEAPPMRMPGAMGAGAPAPR